MINITKMDVINDTNIIDPTKPLPGYYYSIDGIEPPIAGMYPSNPIEL